MPARCGNGRTPWIAVTPLTTGQCGWNGYETAIFGSGMKVRVIVMGKQYLRV